MKTSIIFLGLVALTLSTSNATPTFKSQDLDQQEFTALNAENNQENLLIFAKTSNSIRVIESNSNEAIIFDPSTVVNLDNGKTIDEVITENKLIIESNEETFSPLYIETTIEDRIAEQNQIIESTSTNEVYSLDFDIINKKQNDTPDNNAVKVSGIKL